MPLGVILDEMLTGRPPFCGVTPAETIRQVVFEEPIRPSRLIANVPREIETICLKCLQKDPTQRYLSAANLAEDLQNFLESRPIFAREVGVVERLINWTRRRPEAATLVVTLICLVALTLGGAFWFEQQRSAQRDQRARQEGRVSQAVETALQKAAMFEQQGDGPAARRILIDAEALMPQANNPRLEQQLHHASKDVDMVTGLEELRMRVADESMHGNHQSRCAGVASVSRVSI